MTRGLLERLRPASWPVRWRIAAICAGLTAAILICFALMLGNLVGDRVRSDFEDELRAAASALASETEVVQDPIRGPIILSPRLDDYAIAGDAVIQIVDAEGTPLASTDSTDLGPPRAEVSETNSFRVATAEVAESNPGPSFVQYARPGTEVESTIDRIWFFLATGVLGGTALATLAGLAVANRAMRPISSLTAQARDIAATRDPSRRMPVQETEDEVGELSRTMDEMLRGLDAARTERERALERQREFVADASHELRTPLTSVQANLELLQSSHPGDGGDAEAIASGLRSTRRMSRLVGDLLLLARADAGRAGARAELDLAEIAAAAVSELEPVAGERSLRTDLEEPLPVEGNTDELTRVVLNLLDNAIRHTPDGSAIEVRSRTEGDRAVLEVSDDGPGVPGELSEQVFERFVRGGGPADTAAGGGSGLGLAIVRAVARSHGGSVEVSDAPGRGARFTVSLPLAAPARVRPEERQPEGSV